MLLLKHGAGTGAARMRSTLDCKGYGRLAPIAHSERLWQLYKPADKSTLARRGLVVHTSQ